MRLALAAGIAVLTLSSGLQGAPALGQEAAVDAGRISEQELARVARTYQWESEFEPTVDGLIEATRSFPSFWSGSQNRDSEAERIARAREIVLAERETILADGASRLSEVLDPEDLEDHLQRIDEGAFGEADVPYREAIHEAYRDAIFDALSRAGLQANREIEGF